MRAKLVNLIVVALAIASGVRCVGLRRHSEGTTARQLEDNSIFPSDISCQQAGPRAPCELRRSVGLQRLHEPASSWAHLHRHGRCDGQRPEMTRAKWQQQGAQADQLNYESERIVVPAPPGLARAASAAITVTGELWVGSALAAGDRPHRHPPLLQSELAFRTDHSCLCQSPPVSGAMMQM